VQTRGYGGNRSDGRSWLLIKHRDDWAGDLDITTFAPLSVKNGGDLHDILAADNPDVWQTNRPAAGGETGALLRKVIERAAALKHERDAPSEKPPVRKTARKSVRKTTRKRAKSR
jgi:hypothetical protein